MKNILLFAFSLSVVAPALACDSYMKKFPVDCAIQDKFVALREGFAKHGIDINEIAEYRTARFIDRYNLYYAQKNKVPPKSVYNPAPMTWFVWDEGIRTLFTTPSYKGRLNGRGIEIPTMAHVNTVLLTNGSDNIKDPNTDQKKRPGEFRSATDTGIGYCNPADQSIDLDSKIVRSNQSVNDFDRQWSELYDYNFGFTFKELVRRDGGLSPDMATLGGQMSVNRALLCADTTKTWVSYVPGTEVENQLSWMQVFINANLDAYSKNQGVIEPIRFAAFVQKWFVTIHPFGDGNGRTSRAIQDMIRAHFDLPFAPAADLQEDATAVFNDYVDLDYKFTNDMLSLLDYCYQSLGKPLHQDAVYRCSTVSELNNLSP